MRIFSNLFLYRTYRSFGCNYLDSNLYNIGFWLLGQYSFHNIGFLLIIVKGSIFLYLILLICYNRRVDSHYPLNLIWTILDLISKLLTSALATGSLRFASFGYESFGFQIKFTYPFVFCVSFKNFKKKFLLLFFRPYYSILSSCLISFLIVVVLINWSMLFFVQRSF